MWERELVVCIIIQILSVYIDLGLNVYVGAGIGVVATILILIGQKLVLKSTDLAHKTKVIVWSFVTSLIIFTFVLVIL
jgi:hypothetical protein